MACRGSQMGSNPCGVRTACKLRKGLQSRAEVWSLLNLVALDVWWIFWGALGSPMGSLGVEPVPPSRSKGARGIRQTIFMKSPIESNHMVPSGLQGQSRAFPGGGQNVGRESVQTPFVSPCVERSRRSSALTRPRLACGQGGTPSHPRWQGFKRALVLAVLDNVTAFPIVL
eukprot:981456-Amphidinium_carterae.1